MDFIWRHCIIPALTISGTTLLGLLLGDNDVVPSLPLRVLLGNFYNMRLQVTNILSAMREDIYRLPQNRTHLFWLYPLILRQWLVHNAGLRSTLDAENTVVSLLGGQTRQCLYIDVSCYPG